ncbi:MAG: hypothetical protein V3R64_07805 [Sphingomonadales bacterium]
MITPAHVRMARAALKLGIRELAEQAEISTGTVVRFEKGLGVHAGSLRAMEDVFRAAGVEFIEENGGGPGVRLKK